MKITRYMLTLCLASSLTFAEVPAIGKLRLCKEYVLGIRDYLYGKYYLSNPKNCERNFIKGYETSDCWKREVINRVCDKIHKHSVIPSTYMNIVKEKPEYLRQVFKAAAMQINVPVMEELLQIDSSLANLNLSDNRAQSALYDAVEAQNLPAVQLLAKHGAHAHKCITIRPGYYSAYDTAQSIDKLYQMEVIARRAALYVLDEDTETAQLLNKQLFYLQQQRAVAANILAILQTLKK